MSRALIPISDARADVLAASVQLPSEPVPLAIALDRVLAEDVVAAADVPPFGNSAMDGFAVHHGPSRRSLRIVGEARAGSPAGVVVGRDEAVRISTGAPLPDGAEAVIRVEDTIELGDSVLLSTDIKAGLNVRKAGEDLRAGTVVLRAGTRLGPGELAVAVGAGLAEVGCTRAPRVVVLCTGDELREPGAPLGPGEIHNSNAVMLAALARQAGAELLTVARVQDTLAATEAAFADALTQADVVLASGGVSVGPHDHVKPALAALGVQERFWRVSLQPGKPTWFGQRGDQLVFGLPGNPVSSYVTFLLFARPALLALQGHAQPLPPRGEALLTIQMPLRDREQAVRVRLDDRDGLLRATPNGAQGSHITGSLAGADGLAFLPPGGGQTRSGASFPIERI
ncbi:gephyrin-like molybdotransferase Glp [Conexibacter stalactiti]|uniref:Molybdopterin molybdenumtransferase n=1 Tax=Conexibacter stalactiti TaxID=1940611 RepID=A0ABU4HYY7_9ACTN|nr:gephyrin-like molybdotransferase Glp [Conexibacter stalactiti]MDW5597274.1 molybdopterin molybdotransferase MoeA [Conexibacter stalactiti]MEC5037916.1 gephyrin-like molybdotransferase Glp [Conexibacter stalactiti]